MSTIYLYAPSDYSGKWNTLIDTDKIKTLTYIDFEESVHHSFDEILNKLRSTDGTSLCFDSKKFTTDVTSLCFDSGKCTTYNSSRFSFYNIEFKFRFDPKNNIYIYTELTKYESYDENFHPYETNFKRIANLKICINKYNHCELLNWEEYEKWGYTSYSDIKCNAAVLLGSDDYKSIEEYPFLTEFVINFTSFLLNNNEKLNKFLTIWSNRNKIKNNSSTSSNHYMDPDRLQEEMRKLDRREQWIEAGMDEAVEDGYR